MTRTIRYTQPTKFDKAPQGTLWECHIDPTCSLLYIQVNTNQDQPQWMKMDSFLGIIFEKHFDSPGFIAECLKQYSLLENTALGRP